ncbi:putative AbiEii toxin of type IV toxin-antitoxin system [Kribbella voronezhensis]|uniref:Putative AbiEii toxin of type IV toxin-antitoxin system n=1 Tax=Kribbella voronezhensis TaxID=2512212 RepID=A0A4R7SXC5_9ACTN|nr:putative AbiEii toxin of type IV toxin-antitoxin system [Kribbella voronezhensis]
MIFTSGADITSDGLVQQQAGARWWGIDIHAHSPGSFDYGGIEGHANKAPKPSFKDWLRSYINAGLDGLVVTDHNSHAGIEPARQALAELRVESPELPPFVIFPGLELTVTGGTHILGIFDPACDAEVVNRVLTLCEYNGTRGHSDETANKTVVDAAAIINTEGGICVPAHADQSRGVFKIDSRDLETLIGSQSILAVEVVDDANVGKAESAGWVPVLGSDAHHLTTDGCPDGLEAKAPGTHLTRIKAETLDLEGLRLALTDPTHSVRRARLGDSDPNNTEHGHIDRIRLEHDGVTEDYRFGPWMNCLIGGRGVGKSTLVEVVRLALGRSHELAGSVAVDLKRFHPSADRAERWWDEKTRIIVEYTKDGRQLRVTWSGDEPDMSILELLEGDAWHRQAGRVFDRVPIRVFSQKQIYELATSPRSFLTILDDMPSIRRSQWDIEYEELELKFKGERNKLRQLLAEAARSDRIRGQLEEVQGRLHRLAELQSTQQYEELTETETRIRHATTAEDRAESIEQSLGTQAAELRGLVTDVLQGTDYADRATSFAFAADLLEQAASALAAARTSWQSQATSASWRARVEELNAWLAEQIGAFQADGEQTQADRQREAELQAELLEVESSGERQQEQEVVIAQLMKELTAKRTELFRRRQEFAGHLNADSTRTRVNLHAQGDVETIGAALRALLGCPESFESAFGKDGIAAFLLNHEPKDPRFPIEVVKFKAALVELVEKGADSEIGQSLKIDARFYSRLAAADTFDLVTNIKLWFPQDLVAVQYRQTEGGNFTSVDQGSPGQKTAALLTVILQMGTDPLLLDQPEDDLENKLIKQLAVETLKTIKTRRQIVVSTHNANIVVTSAAENILVLEHGESIPKIETEGTLQVPAVKANVCVILEGGEDAIKTRYRRLVGTTDA